MCELCIYCVLVCTDVCMHAFMNVGRLWMAKWLSIPTVARLKTPEVDTLIIITLTFIIYLTPCTRMHLKKGRYN